MAEATVKTSESKGTRQIFGVETDDVQGLVASGYGHLYWASYVLLKVQEPSRARRWLAALLPEITAASAKPCRVSSLNLAFTWRGLEAIGLPPQDLCRFPPAFREGMAAEHRARILGDDGDSLKYWRWGAHTERKPDILLLIYARERETLRERLRHFAPPEAGLRVQRILHAVRLPDDKEHFGFADGISQPAIKGFE